MNYEMPTNPVSRKSRNTFRVGEFVVEEMDAREWGPATLREHAGLTDAQVESAMSDATVSPEIAAGLARAFGTSVELWLNLGHGLEDASGVAPLKKPPAE